MRGGVCGQRMWVCGPRVRACFVIRSLTDRLHTEWKCGNLFFQFSFRKTQILSGTREQITCKRRITVFNGKDLR